MENEKRKERIVLSFIIVAIGMFILGFTAGRVFQNFAFWKTHILGATKNDHKYHFDTLEELEQFILVSMQKDLDLTDKQVHDITPCIDSMLKECFDVKKNSKILVERSLAKCRKNVMSFLTDRQKKKLIKRTSGHEASFINKVTPSKKK